MDPFDIFFLSVLGACLLNDLVLYECTLYLAADCNWCISQIILGHMVLWQHHFYGYPSNYPLSIRCYRPFHCSGAVPHMGFIRIIFFTNFLQRHAYNIHGTHLLPWSKQNVEAGSEAACISWLWICPFFGFQCVLLRNQALTGGRDQPHLAISAVLAFTESQIHEHHAETFNRTKNVR